MKTFRKTIALLLSLLLAGAMVCLLPQEARAATGPIPVLCVSIDGNGEAVGVEIGIPVKRSNGLGVFAHEGLYTSDDLIYFADIGEEGAFMTYSGSSVGVDMFNVESGDANLCYDVGFPVIGQKGKLVGFNSDLELLSYNIQVTGGSEDLNSVGMYDLEINFTKFGEFVAPVAVLDESGALIGMVVSYNGTAVYGFGPVEAAAGSGSAEPETDTPKEEEKPEEDSPEAPSRGSSEDASEEAQEESSEEPGSTGENEEASSSETTTPGKDIIHEDDDYTWLIVGGVLLVLAVVLIVLFTRKKKPIPGENHKLVFEDYPPTKPADSEYPKTKPVPEKPGWEDDTTDNEVGLFAVGVAGVLKGREYPISERGILCGREEDADVRYPAETKGVSRRHCRVFWKDGVLVLMDVGSKSGTLLRGKGPIPANEPVPVVEGDVFYLGSKENALTIRLK